MIDTQTIRADFDRIAGTQRDRPERLDRYERDLLSRVPRRCRVALDVGCGIGIATRALARRADTVEAIDLSPAMIEIARSRTSDANVRYEIADVLDHPLPPARYDCVISIATLHHVPLAAALDRLRRSLAPGGRLLVLDLCSSTGFRERLLDLVALGASMPGALRRRDPMSSAAWAAHRDHDDISPLAAVRRISDSTLPGARIRRRLRWRYELVWDQPLR